MRFIGVFIGASVLIGLASPIALADELKWSGQVDFYFQLSPQAHSPQPSTSGGPEVVEGRYFDRHSNEMTLNMAQIALERTHGRSTFSLELSAGEMVDQLAGGGSQSVTQTNPTNSAANEPTRNITRATLGYRFTDELQVTVGKFYTHVGFEGTSAKDNFQYSRSYFLTTVRFGTRA